MGAEKLGETALEEMLSEGLDPSELKPTSLSSEVCISETILTAKIRVRDNTPSLKGKQLDVDGIFRDVVGLEIFVLKGWIDQRGNKLFTINQHTNIEQIDYDTYEITVTFTKGAPIIPTIPLIKPSLN